jgi:hypothetical protein
VRLRSRRWWCWCVQPSPDDKITPERLRANCRYCETAGSLFEPRLVCGRCKYVKYQCPSRACVCSCVLCMCMCMCMCVRECESACLCLFVCVSCVSSRQYLMSSPPRMRTLSSLSLPAVVIDPLLRMRCRSEVVEVTSRRSLRLSEMTWRELEEVKIGCWVCDADRLSADEEVKEEVCVP